jgi:hypothetical protein
VFRQAAVEISYVTKARISEEVERCYAGPPVRNLTQDDLIRELEKLGVPHEDAVRQVDAYLTTTAMLDIAQLRTILSNDDPLTADTLVLHWAAQRLSDSPRLTETTFRGVVPDLS